MTEESPERSAVNEEWKRFLQGTEPLLRYGRSLLQFLPSPPRCKLCHAPFTGPFAPLMRMIGKRPWNRNPQLCQFCANWLIGKGPGGAEVHLTLLFADVRGSTSLAETMSPAAYSQVIGRFFRAATDAFVEGGAITDQLVGDEAIGLFLPGYAGPHHARRAIESAHALLNRLPADPGDTKLPVGIGIHSGLTFVGSVGSEDAFTDFTAVGDTVNTGARLSASAGPGEILVSDVASREAALDTSKLEQRSLELKGKSESVEVWVVRSDPAFF